jgi:hypothetical protein
MLTESLERLLGDLPDEARVMDIGGWAAPLNRADWVLDLMPYETRGRLPPGSFGPRPERFGTDTWVQRDICDHEPYPFEDDYFDFAVCTYTLEDLRDPVWVCRETSRIAKAGLIEVPSLLDELSWRVPQYSGGDWVGHDHHRWLCFTGENEIEFMHKPHSLHADRRARVPSRHAARLAHRQRAQVLWWRGDLRASERIVIGAFPMDELEERVSADLGLSSAERRLRSMSHSLPSLLRRALRR